MVVKLKDVAQKAGVSLSTVSQVLNGKGSISKSTRQEVISVANKLGYQHLKKNYFIIFCNNPASNLTRIPNEYFKGIKNELNDELCMIVSDNEEKSSVIHYILEDLEDIDGFILFGKEENPNVKKLTEHGIKGVAINRILDNDNISSVNFANEHYFYEITEHLIEHGHKKILFAGLGSGYSFSRLRIKGYKRAMQDHKLQDKYLNNFYLVKNKNTTAFNERVKESASQLIESFPDITAIVAENDFIAKTILGKLQENNIKVPEDIAIFSCDDVDLAVQTEPELSTVGIPARRMGSEAVRLLKKIVNNEIFYCETTLPGEIIYRKSCGC